MAGTRIEAIDSIKRHIAQKEHFVLNGGAGSGKTYTLGQVLDFLIDENPKSKTACITYTNVAANEIKERFSEKLSNIKAATIHDFLWGEIKNYQKNLKKILAELVESGHIKYKGEETLDITWYQDKSIEYREWTNLEKGIISHNEVLKLANKLFESSPLLRRITRDKYGCILIDEYQDTQSVVVEIFLDHLQKETSSQVIGFFGDKMQAIYNTGIGSLQSYIDSGAVQNVFKDDNRRCSTEVIDLVNQVRNDGLKQEPKGDNKKGKVTFLYSFQDDISLQEIKQHDSFAPFDFEDFEENKELYLTHKLIAKEMGFETIWSSYKYTENLVSETPDKLAKHLYKIQEIIDHYDQKRYNEFIKATDFKIKTGRDKKLLKENIDDLRSSSKHTIEETIQLAHDLQLVLIDEKLTTFLEKNEDFYEKIKTIPFQEIENLYHYRNDNTPYSTQHSVKGAEYNNVFVALDNGKWNQYSFKHLFEETSGKESIIERTRKIFYVCCSRAKENLVVYFHKPSNDILIKAREWFGENNVLEK